MNAPDERALQQSRLGSKGLIAFLIFGNMFIPLSTDIYLPSLPAIGVSFRASTPLVNLTLTTFFFFYAVGIMLWGPLSDRYGRRPFLICGSALYALASVGCAFSHSIGMLIVARMLQGMGTGAITTLTVAIIKDCYRARERETILGLIYTLGGLAPMVAPLLGAQLLRLGDWRLAFYMLALFGCLDFLLCLLYEETLRAEERYCGRLAGAYGRLWAVVQNRSFFYPALLFALPSLAYMGYVSISSFIYIRYFGLSAQVYSYYFALNASLAILAPMIYLKWFRDRNKQKLGYGYALGTLLAGLLLFVAGRGAPWAFFLCFLPYALLSGSVRTFSVNWILEQHQGDSGASSSVLSASSTILNCLGMFVAAVYPGNIVSGLVILMMLSGAVLLVGWRVFLRSSIPCVGVKTAPKQDSSQLGYASE